ncbi:MAG: SH3 domain-containing protein [Smithella sp.]|nr:SH3 domain-containing protein [Smithella sp.]HOU51197.1 SH3 domain-containing protein [Smithella sp.]HQG65837.1 SH3 domain-containing protein [Smithella sp.]HQH16111.1 SH3 domain-containing protein [Smithella sp.]HQI72482.1 SH3 domain-containing protein [Smithella sp.]
MKSTHALIYFSLLACLFMHAGCASPQKTVVPPYYPKGSILVVKSERINLRECPSLNCQVIAVLRRGEHMIKVEQQNEWIKVEAKSINRKGWVASRLVGKKSDKKKAAEVTEEWSPQERDQKGASKIREEFSP